MQHFFYEFYITGLKMTILIQKNVATIKYIIVSDSE